MTHLSHRRLDVENEIQYHIACKPGDLAEYLLIPGDPDRVPKIASFWDESNEVASHREFRSFTGKYRGVQLSAMSSGIGPSCIAIAVNESAKLGVHTFIRVGSTGSIQKEIKCGDLVISTSAVRLDWTSNHYVIPEYPAVANYEVVQALIEAAETLGFKYHVGITASSSDFYAGQARPSYKGYWQSRMNDLIPYLQNAKVLNFEMECATLFVLCSLFTLRAGGICAVYADRLTNTFQAGEGEDECIQVANEAVKLLSEWDREKENQNKQWLYPKLLNV
jgi:uridine phosphorylase